MGKYLPTAALLALLPSAALAEWTASGELGVAATRGNSHSENVNTKLAFEHESNDWTHKFGLAAVRARNEVLVDSDGDGELERRSELSANRYQVQASSGYKVNERGTWVGSLRYESDDFAAYAEQATLSLGFGYKLVDNARTVLSTELGPGYRRAEPVDGGTESDLIFRALVDYRQTLTANTALTNLLLVESGESNTSAQNDLGVSVAMNSRLALKTGVQLRYNSEVDPGIGHTDTLMTVNLVYTIK